MVETKQARISVNTDDLIKPFMVVTETVYVDLLKTTFTFDCEWSTRDELRACPERRLVWRTVNVYVVKD